MTSEKHIHPIAIIEDRYSGVYSDGRWLALNGADTLDNGCYRIVRTLENGPHGDDGDAMAFWVDPPNWIASGNTPDQALANLIAKLAPKATS
jgi:hypothetical protein